MPRSRRGGEELAKRPQPAQPAPAEPGFRVGGWTFHGAQLYVALLLAGLAVGFATWPIFAADTDLWYHLNGGRFMATSHGLPHEAFFSYLQPSPAWLDYYWLCQLLLYGVHAVSGYLGLVELRALVAVGTYALILATLRIGRGRGEGWGATAVVFTCASLFLIGRLTMVRPGNFSYLMIAAFLFVLESRRALLALPALALVWMNLHGIEYPVMALILGAYLGEWALARAGAFESVPPPPWRGFAAASAALLAVFATPYGLALLGAPFRSLTFASQYIQELKPVDWAETFSLTVNGLYLGRGSFLTVLLVLSVLALLNQRRATVRPAHLALFAAALFLLLRIARFSAEFVLLVVPVVGAFRPRLVAGPLPPRPVRIALCVLLAVFPFWHLYKVLETTCAFPLCTRQLPEGSVAFLAKVGATGNVQNHPNDGGYLEWELYPRQKIYADLQTPFLFSDRDVFRGDQAFQDPAVLVGLVAEYHPPFLVVPKKISAFATWVGSVSDYVPVFVDDDSVLYASASLAPEVVARFQLTAIDPFALQVIGDSKDPQQVARAEAELARANEIYPRGGRMRVFQGALALARGDTDAALRIADAVIAFHPDRWEAQRLRGDVLLVQQRNEEAARAYEAALARLDDEVRATQTYYLGSRLWALYAKLGRPQDAYRALRDALGDLYHANVGPDELASLAQATLDAGHTAEGRTLFEFALAKTPPTQPELRRRLEAQLRALPVSR